MLAVHGERFNICSFEEKKEPRFIAYAYYHGVNTSTVANFKLPTAFSDVLAKFLSVRKLLLQAGSRKPWQGQHPGSGVTGL